MSPKLQSLKGGADLLQSLNRGDSYFSFWQGQMQILEFLELANYLTTLNGTSNINHKSVMNSLCIHPLTEIVSIIRLVKH